MKKISVLCGVLVAITAFCLIGCGSSKEKIKGYLNKQIEVIRKPMADELIDPGSVQYRNEKVIKSSIELSQRGNSEWIEFDLCFELNAKNRLGAYVGFSPRVMTMRGNLTNTEDEVPGVEAKEIYAITGPSQAATRSIQEYMGKPVQISRCEEGTFISVDELATMIVANEIPKSKKSENPAK